MVDILVIQQEQVRQQEEDRQQEQERWQWGNGNSRKVLRSVFRQIAFLLNPLVSICTLAPRGKMFLNKYEKVGHWIKKFRNFRLLGSTWT
jgi:hypothetical protein